MKYRAEIIFTEGGARVVESNDGSRNDFYESIANEVKGGVIHSIQITETISKEELAEYLPKPPTCCVCGTTACASDVTTTPCRARQVNDQMLCPCGKQWDVNDPEPPGCGARTLIRAARQGGKPTMVRAAYLAFIDRLFGITPR